MLQCIFYRIKIRITCNVERGFDRLQKMAILPWISFQSRWLSNQTNEFKCAGLATEVLCALSSLEEYRTAHGNILKVLLLNFNIVSNCVCVYFRLYLVRWRFGEDKKNYCSR